MACVIRHLRENVFQFIFIIHEYVWKILHMKNLFIMHEKKKKKNFSILLLIVFA